VKLLLQCHSDELNGEVSFVENQKWIIKEFRELARLQFPAIDMTEIDSTLSSILWKVNICKFHIEEYQRIMNQSVNSNIHPYVYAVGKILESSAGTEAGKEFWATRFISEAHIIAYAHSLHSLADIYAHLLVFSIDLKSKFKNPRRINFSSVCKEIKNENHSSIIVDKMENLQFSEEFKYLNAFINITKHRSLVPVNYSLNFIEERYGLKFNDFKYDGDEFQPKWAEEFTGVEFEKLLNMFQKIGIELNEYLKTQYKNIQKRSNNN
jgi:hypothetical protein